MEERVRLSTWMDDKQVSAADLAAKIGVTPTAVRRYAAGRRTPTPVVMKAIVVATAGAVTPTDFYNLTETVD